MTDHPEGALRERCGTCGEPLRDTGGRSNVGYPNVGRLAFFRCINGHTVGLSLDRVLRAEESPDSEPKRTEESDAAEVEAQQANVEAMRERFQRFGSEGETAQTSDADFEYRARMWALANVERNGSDKRICGHTDLLTDLDCVDCAAELGRRAGHVEAGAFLTHGQAMAQIREDISAAHATEPEGETAERCHAKNDKTGERCGRVSGHTGDHTSLIDSRFLERPTWTNPIEPPQEEGAPSEDVCELCGGTEYYPNNVDGEWCPGMHDVVRTYPDHGGEPCYYIPRAEAERMRDDAVASAFEKVFTLIGRFRESQRNLAPDDRVGDGVVDVCDVLAARIARAADLRSRGGNGG